MTDPLSSILCWTGLSEDRRGRFSPEIVIVTGDLAYSGRMEEYQKAEKFLTDLLGTLGLGKERLFIVPGNHDVNRKRYRPKDLPKYETVDELNDELEHYRADLLKGMEDYFCFVETTYPRLKPLKERLIPFVTIYPAECRKKIGLVGLNSAWMCRKSPDRDEIAIGEYQVKKAAEELRSKGDLDCSIYLFHHPLGWLWPEDRRICRQYMNDALVLNGHFHEEGGGYIKDFAGSLHHFQAGAAYDGSAYPNSFHYLTLNWEEGRVLVDCRVFSNAERRWYPDSNKGPEGRFCLDPSEMGRGLLGRGIQGSWRAEELERDKFFRGYFKGALEEHRYLPTQGFETNLRHPIAIEGVFVNLKASLHPHEFQYTLEGREKMEEKRRDQQLSSLDIKAAFEVSREVGIKDLVILGDPGSGKTTLLKYILVMVVEGLGLERLALPSNLIPFLAPLRNLKNPAKDEFLQFLWSECDLGNYGLSQELLHKVLEKGQALVLLDGLDEVANEEIRVRTCRWVDRARRKYGRSPFVMTSRFAGYQGESRLVGAALELAVQDLSLSEAEDFLLRWFGTVDVALHPHEDRRAWKAKGEEKARKLIHVIREKDYLQKLAVNPLMLQIIALVHRDRGTLPERRVELYDECINVLLEKWDAAKGLDVTLRAKEARQILQPLALWLHEKEGRRYAPLEEIVQVVKVPLAEMGRTGVAAEVILKNIRDRSGIFMGYSEKEYGFTHLSFQEYLTAERIRNDANTRLLIDKYGKQWWREVILLALGLSNPSIIEPFLRGMVLTEKFKTDITLVMDGLRDSLIKPADPFIEALQKKNLAPEIRSNAIRALRTIGGEKAIAALRSVTQSEEIPLAVSAFEALDGLGAAARLKKPVPKFRLHMVNPRDRAPMVLIPGGTFLYGSRDDDKMASSNEKPQQVVDLPAYYMDMYPVTNSQYADFLNETKPNRKTLEIWINLGGKFERESCRIRSANSVFEVESGYENCPVIYVSWYGAEDYARWAGKRLPSEKEWEKAARGTDGRVYPWENSFDKSRCTTREGGWKCTTPVDAHPKGKSPYNCYDMAGNVWEWTTSQYERDQDLYVLRGGSWATDHRFARCACRTRGRPGNRLFAVGFRCARNVE
ncbi:MAG: SUMF1/EgtB/PvdO family nonheme iron enzyme [Thermodesulfobacteriota bacterium]